MSHAVTSKGQVTIPKTVRDLLGIGPGSLLDFELSKSGEVVLRPVQSRRRASGRFSKLRGRGTIKMSTEAILALTRGAS